MARGRRQAGSDAERLAKLAAQVHTAHSRIDQSRLVEELCHEQVIARFAWGRVALGRADLRGLLARTARVTSLERLQVGPLWIGPSAFGYTTSISRRMVATGEHYTSECFWLFRPDSTGLKIAEMEQFMADLRVWDGSNRVLDAQASQRWMLERFGDPTP